MSSRKFNFDNLSPLRTWHFLPSEMQEQQVISNANLSISYVLSGIADGRYGVRKEWDKPITISYFAENLPADLKTCFYDAFKARFPDGRSYGKVKPLLRHLVRKGRIGEADASRKAVVGEETLGAVLKALRGYAVVTDGEISLSSEALRMWLGDSTHNAEFGV